jgi:hypothetical protein
VAIAPSYVTYSSAAVQDVVGFFRSDEALELSRLQAQAAARTDKLRHMAQLQLQALSQRSAQQKPRMQLLMTLHAPKVAIPGGPRRCIEAIGALAFLKHISQHRPAAASPALPASFSLHWFDAAESYLG